MAEAICTICGSPFSFYVAGGAKGIYCGIGCRDLGLSKIMKDKFDKAGRRTPRITQIRQSAEHKKWRRNILERDGMACVWCGNKDRLQVDHIIPLAHLLNEMDLGQNVDLYDPDNGRTLCVPCHEKTSSYGQQVRFSIEGRIMEAIRKIHEKEAPGISFDSFYAAETEIIMDALKERLQ